MTRNDPIADLLESARQNEIVGGGRTAAQTAERAWEVFERRKLRGRRLRMGVGLVTCYVGGLLTMWLLTPVRPADSVPSTIAQTPVSVPEPGGNVDEAEAPFVTERPLPAETRVANSASLGDPQETPYRTYCRLGNRYLRRSSGIEAAAECYRLALDAATEAERQPAEQSDSWLLLALKAERT